MTRQVDQIRKRIEPLADDLKRQGVTALYLFGSVARGSAGLDSDVDLFLDYDPESGVSLIDMVRISRQLTSALGRQADLHTRAGLHPLIRDRIISEAKRIL